MVGIHLVINVFLLIPQLFYYSQDIDVAISVISNFIQVGVVGRTGAGKHSMVAAILRLFEPNGVIRIDGVDTATLSLKVGNITKIMKI